MNISEFAASKGVQMQAVAKYLSRHPELKALTKQDGNNVILTKEVIQVLDQKYPDPKPVQVVQGVDPEVHQELLNRFTELQATVIELQAEKVESATLVAQAETMKIMLEDKLQAKEAEAEKTKEQLEAAQEEIDRLRKRKFWDRVFNR